MIVEPIAGDDTAANLNPVGRIYYSASTLCCVPASLSQEVGLGLGAQAGEKRLVDRPFVQPVADRGGRRRSLAIGLGGG